MTDDEIKVYAQDLELFFEKPSPEQVRRHGTGFNEGTGITDTEVGLVLKAIRTKAAWL